MTIFPVLGKLTHMCADLQLSVQQANAETTLRQIRDNFETFVCKNVSPSQGGRQGWRANADMCAAADCQLMAPQANGGPAKLLTTPCGGGLGLEDLLYQAAMMYSEIRRCVSTLFFVDPLHKSLQKLVW